MQMRAQNAGTSDLGHDKSAVRKILDQAKAAGRAALTAPEARGVCEAYGIVIPKEGVAKTADEAAALSSSIGFPVVMKIVSPQILHKTEAGGVIVGVKSAEHAREAYGAIVSNARKYDSKAEILGVQVQQMLAGGTEVIIGAVTDPAFGKLVAFGLGGILVEVLKDVTFRLAPATNEDALSMLDGIAAAEILRGVRGAKPVDRRALSSMIERVSSLIADFPEISEMDLNPVFASEHGATAADVRIVLDFNPAPARDRPDQADIVEKMNRIMKPKALAVIGASAENGKIGNSVMKNLINGGYAGEIYPIHPSAESIMGKKAYKSVKDVPGGIDVAVFAIPAKFVAQALIEVGEKKIAGAILIPSGFAETGNVEGQNELIAIGRRYGVRLMGPNIYGFYYTPSNLCATFCTAYDVKGHAALSSQSGGIGMAIIGFSRSAKMGVSAIVGLGNKSDIDEDDLLTFFEQDPNTTIIAQHLEDLKDGRSFAEVAKRVSKKKPIVVLKAGRTNMGARAASSHTGALAETTRSTRTSSSNPE
ncbi:MAG TPA: acetate--CoA ligase family protein [Steroidobacteraceae bacterium]|nr:acetate--CoA ligase family protein [Steroidobacteraceae bacterium]